MSLNVTIKDNDTGSVAKITHEGVVNVVQHVHPPLGESIYPLPFRGRFLNGAVSNMNVDGSVTNQDFSINASNDYDIYVKTIFVEIEDNGAPALNKFGAISGGLTNGVEWIFFNSDLGEYVLHEGLKTNKEFLSIGIDTVGVGTGVDAGLWDTSGGGTTKSYLPIIDIGEMNGMIYGIRLKRGSKDKIIFRIKDDISSIVSLTAVANGQRVS